MSPDGGTGYRVLARKYRPERFSDLIGQEPLVRTLSNAIRLDRLASAYMLSGERGVGKTSTARLLARGLICTGADGAGGATLEPCGQCDSCRSSIENRHPDVLEVDAASHTKVEDARNIIEGAGYRPVSARYKIYVIDEVHMMSKNAFNTIVKTLEDPPESAKFIFATTEIGKVPGTLLSLCQRFDLQRVSAETLAGHMTRICEAENIDADADAVAAIARAAGGSVRDGLSLLDQAAAMNADSINAENIEGMLGRPGRATAISMVKAVVEHDSASALGLFNEALVNGADPAQLVGDLMEIAHDACMKASGGSLGTVLEGERKAIEGIAGAGLARLGGIWQILVKGSDEVASAPRPGAAAEMLLIRMSHQADLPSPGEIAEHLARTNEAGTTQGDEAMDNTQAQRVTHQDDGHHGYASHSNEGAGHYHADQPTRYADTPPGGQAQTGSPAQFQQQTQSSAQAGASEPAPETGQLTVADIHEIALNNNKPGLARAIRAHIRPVSIDAENGSFEVGLEGETHPEFLPKLAHLLYKTTGSRWVISVVANADTLTLDEWEDAVQGAMKQQVSGEAMMQKVMKTFPDAEIVSVKKRGSKKRGAAQDNEIGI